MHASQVILESQPLAFCISHEFHGIDNQTHIKLINTKIKCARIDERTKENFINFLSHRVSLQKISMANYIRIKSRGKHLVEELEAYINKH